MLGGAVAVLITGQISPSEAAASINPDVMIFLFGMFVAGEAIHRSESLILISEKLFRRQMSMNVLIIMLIALTGLFSAILMNDTIAIIGTSFVLYLSRKYNIEPSMLLLTLAFSVTTGSVMSPVGNPQNLLIAVEGSLENPFLTFAEYLAVPSLISLILIFAVIRLLYPEEFMKCIIPIKSERPKLPGKNPLIRLTKISITLILAVILLKIGLVLFNTGITVPLTAVAVAAALPILIFSHERFRILRNIDWETLIFFAALFILMQSVWNTGIIQSSAECLPYSFTEPDIIFLLGLTVSQIISNVPFVALALPFFSGETATDAGLMALAAGSTLAGNLLIFGAASNIIIIQNAEKKGISLRFTDFAKAGIPLTLLQTIVYYIFFAVL
ncbi:SLC13 family permease [Methanoplanus limicola]|nr:SLC13 family permease [Methanoplanus limicola]